MSRMRILVAEDTTLLRKLLVQQLSREGDLDVIGEAADGREAVEMAAQLTPDAIVMDLSMPHLNGIQATQRVLARQPGIRIVLLTAHEELASLGRLSGACECLVKGCTPQELLAALRRTRTASRRGPSAGATDYGPAIESLAVRGGLSDRERGVVERVVNTELTLQQIAHSLSREWGSPVTESAVKHALERVMNKLGIEPRTRAALIKHVVTLQVPQ